MLIIDADPTQRYLLETGVSRHGYDIAMAKGGEDTIVLMKAKERNYIDLILLDLVIPDVDGFAVMRQVKSRRPNLPIIVLTTQSGINVIVNAMQASQPISSPSRPARNGRLSRWKTP